MQLTPPRTSMRGDSDHPQRPRATSWDSVLAGPLSILAGWDDADSFEAACNMGSRIA